MWGERWYKVLLPPCQQQTSKGMNLSMCIPSVMGVKHSELFVIDISLQHNIPAPSSYWYQCMASLVRECSITADSMQQKYFHIILLALTKIDSSLSRMFLLVLVVGFSLAHLAPCCPLTSAQRSVQCWSSGCCKSIAGRGLRKTRDV